MGKKRKKTYSHKDKRYENHPLNEPKSAETQRFRPVNRVAAVECFKDKQIKTMAVCTKCEHHERDRCTYRGDMYRIKIVSGSEPMRFNRTQFSVSSEGIRDESRNYYFTTDIMSPVKNITDCPEYTELRRQLLSGELWEGTETETVHVTLDDCCMVMTRAEDPSKGVFFDNGIAYEEGDNTYKGEELLVKFYLYDMYSMGGLADLMFDGRFYKVKQKPIPGASEKYVIATDGSRIFIGRKHEANADNLASQSH